MEMGSGLMHDESVSSKWTYNGAVPSPMIRVTKGDKVRVLFNNNLVKPTTIHWHGVPVPNNMDGVGQQINPGETFTAEFVARPAGIFIISLLPRHRYPDQH